MDDMIEYIILVDSWAGYQIVKKKLQGQTLTDELTLYAHDGRKTTHTDNAPKE